MKGGGGIGMTSQRFFSKTKTSQIFAIASLINKKSVESLKNPNSSKCEEGEGQSWKSVSKW